MFPQTICTPIRIWCAYFKTCVWGWWIKLFPSSGNLQVFHTLTVLEILLLCFFFPSVSLFSRSDVTVTSLPSAYSHIRKAIHIKSESSNADSPSTFFIFFSRMIDSFLSLLTNFSTCSMSEKSLHRCTRWRIKERLAWFSCRFITQLQKWMDGWTHIALNLLCFVSLLSLKKKTVCWIHVSFIFNSMFHFHLGTEHVTAWNLLYFSGGNKVSWLCQNRKCHR